MHFNNSNTHASAANTKRSYPKKTKVERIADAIVALVERTNGPVFLHEIDQEIAGFKATGKNGYIYFIERDGKETVFWAGMTKCGFEALQSVLKNRRVAVQYVSGFPYVFDVFMSMSIIGSPSSSCPCARRTLPLRNGICASRLKPNN
jgi:hypothetical protein